ncbi:elongation factor P 5-aminopentanone reductase [Lactobacillus corticis]|uniref:3-oxoacyl-ACP reductase n=1 Tax=Lactobacillus corticis TaxID=2201249 RepID=A0A916QH88_9LACO|nr:SDR family NAD(P)-dependent oxidoreductase [Lactobacillus corticis]GFZ26198.1 3-oxoacyl-ACP reductase [Lactobacillus corticis]
MRRAIVFGATGTIGSAICRQLAASGWSLYLHFNQHGERAQALAEELFDQYPEQDFLPIQLDLAASDSALTAFVAQLLPVNAAVFAHGITKYGLLGDQELAAIDQVLQVNLHAPIKLTKLLEKQLLARPHSRIVYLGSVYGGQGSAMETVYSASKAALSAFAQSYARETAASGLSVNVIAPGAVASAMNAIFSPAELAAVKAEIPAGRLAKGSDIAVWVDHLLAEDSDYLTGQTIYIAGGWLR